MSTQGNVPPNRERVFRIFGYEESQVRGLWTNPGSFNRTQHHAIFNKWRTTKSSFTRNDFVNNPRYICIPEQGRTWLLEFLSGGEVRSVKLFRRDEELRGTWSIQPSGQFISAQDNIHFLHIIIRVPNQFQLFVVKHQETENRGSLYHSAIWVGRQGITYCKLIKLPLPSRMIANYTS